MSDRDELRRRARENAQKTPLPEEWGTAVSLEVDDEFEGRYRGRDTDQRGNPVYLFWDEDGELRFFWHAYRLEQGMDNEKPEVGDTVFVFRDENYETRFDKTGEASGIAYGVAVERNEAPLPDAAASKPEPGPSEDGDDIPFLPTSGPHGY
jgi:hypothetical protein